MADIGRGLRTYLAAQSPVSTLVSARLYPDALPQDATMPAIVFTVISGVGEHHMTAAAPLTNAVENEKSRLGECVTISYGNAADPGTTCQELREFVRGQVVPYKYPRKIEFVSDLPKTVSGKIRRNELKTKEFIKK